MNEKQLECNGLILTELTLEDAGEVFQMTSDPEVARFMRFNTHTSLEEAKALILDLTQEGYHSFLIREKASGEMVGVYALETTETPGLYGLSLFSQVKFWGKGYMTRIMLEMEQYAKDVLHAHRLQGHIVADNKGSVKVAEKCGYSLVKTMQVEGLDCPLLLYRKEL